MRFERSSPAEAAVSAARSPSSSPHAGVAVAGPVGSVPIEDWEWIIRVNLLGVVHGCHLLAPRFKSLGRGYILNVASAAGLISTREMAPYNCTKAAVVALSETLMQEA